jgi:hypothetical protein
MPFQQYPFKGGVPSGDTAGRPGNPVIGDTYYNGQVEALEIYNGTTWKVAKTEGFPPDTPTISSVTDSSTSLVYSSTAGTLDIVFTPSGTGGTATQYNAYTTAGGHSGFTTVGNTVKITGLTPGTAYTVYGNAQNSSGTSTNTPNAGPVTPTTLPQAPTIGTATGSNSTSDVVVTWTLGNNGSKNLSAITITPYLNGTSAGAVQNAATTSSTTHTFTGLSAGSYTFKVKATNANGTSPESSASNSVTIPSFLSVDYLVVAGGASGGGNYQGAGGGAGGYRTTIGGTALTVATGVNYTVTVGAGGASVNTTGVPGNDGGNSVFGSITSTGGGGGGCNSVNGRNGGSGGGAGAPGPAPSSQAGQASPSGQGNNGGIGWDGTATCTLSGGGGGAGAVGGNSSQTCGGGTGSGGNGGAGLSNNITGSSVTYAGGGAGGTDTGSGSGGTGGAGGGGNGGRTNSSAGQPGAANLGGGGGGSTTNGAFNGSGAGGSGIVILRWLTSAGTLTVGSGLTADATGTTGSYSFRRITAGSGNVSWS